MSIQATLFKRPHGKTEEITMRHINAGASEYINKTNVKVSFEDCGQIGVTVYFDYGATIAVDDDTPDEIIVMANGRSCEDVMDEGVALIKKARGEQ